MLSFKLITAAMVHQALAGNDFGAGTMNNMLKEYIKKDRQYDLCMPDHISGEAGAGSDFASCQMPTFAMTVGWKHCWDMPDSCPGVFASDFDLSNAEISAVQDHLEKCNSHLSPNNQIGGYGGHECSVDCAGTGNDVLCHKRCCAKKAISENVVPATSINQFGSQPKNYIAEAIYGRTIEIQGTPGMYKCDVLQQAVHMGCQVDKDCFGGMNVELSGPISNEQASSFQYMTPNCWEPRESEYILPTSGSSNNPNDYAGDGIWMHEFLNDYFWELRNQFKPYNQQCLQACESRGGEIVGTTFGVYDGYCVTRPMVDVIDDEGCTGLVETRRLTGLRESSKDRRAQALAEEVVEEAL